MDQSKAWEDRCLALKKNEDEMSSDDNARQNIKNSYERCTLLWKWGGGSNQLWGEDSGRTAELQVLSVASKGSSVGGCVQVSQQKR